MQAIIDIKDGYELQVAKEIGYLFDPSKPPTPEDAIAAIVAIFNEKYVQPVYSKAVDESPAVKAKEAELEAARAAERAKFEDAKLQEVIAAIKV